MQYIPFQFDGLVYTFILTFWGAIALVGVARGRRMRLPTGEIATGVARVFACAFVTIFTFSVYVVFRQASEKSEGVRETRSLRLRMGARK